MGAALGAARAAVQRRVAIARHRLDLAERGPDMVADEAQASATMPGHRRKGGTSNGAPPHSRHMLAVRTSCQVGSTPLTPAASCQASNESTWPRCAGIGVEPGAIIGLALADGQLLRGERGGEESGEERAGGEAAHRPLYMRKIDPLQPSRPEARIRPC